MNSRCIIYSAADYYGNTLRPKTADFVIAADGGYKFVQENAITANLLVGDFDSLGEIPNHPNIIRHPVEKDDTDTMLAVRLAIERGYKNIFVFGGTGGKRFDHTLANIQSLHFAAENKVSMFVFGENYVISAVCNGTMTFDSKFRGFVSVFSACDAASGVYLNGLKYTLNDVTLSNCIPLGTSNEFINTQATISVKKGTLFVIWNTDENSSLPEIEFD